MMPCGDFDLGINIGSDSLVSGGTKPLPVIFLDM